MNNYTTDQLKDLLLHIVAEGVEKHIVSGQDVFENLLAAMHIASALTVCGIPAQNPTHRLVSAAGWANGQAVGPLDAVKELPGAVEVQDFIFNPKTSTCSTWEDLRNTQLLYQEQKRSLGLACEWTICTPPAYKFSQDHVQTLIDIIKPWQAQIQHSAITQELPIAEKPQFSPFGKKM